MKLARALLLSLSFLPGCSSTSARLHPEARSVESRAPRADMPHESPALTIAEGALAYRIERVMGEHGADLVVHLAFRGGATGETKLKLPNEWGGKEHLYERLTDFASEDGLSSLVDGSTPDEKIVRTKPNAEVRVRYRIPNGRDQGADGGSNPYRPIVEDAAFHLIGETFLVVPDGSSKETHSIRLTWDGFPTGTTFANSFGAGTAEQTIQTDITSFRHAVYVGGDYRLTRVDVRERPVYLAIRGTWSFSDEALAYLAKAVISEERSFFHDDDFPYFLITVIPTGERCCSFGGTGLTNSFATFLSDGAALDGRIKHLLAHELFHTWNGRRIGRQEPEQLVYWFSEGFTDYYANLSLLRAGLIDLPAYVATYDKTLRDYYLSPARTAKNEDILAGFWKDRSLERLPYMRGDVLAHEWNERIRSQSKGEHSVDDVMLDLFGEAMKDGTVVSAENVDRITKKYVANGIRDDIDRFVDRGDLIEPSASALGPCVSLRHEKVGPFDIGFDEEATDKSGNITGIETNGPAFRAGVRDGMKLVHLRYHSDPESPAEVTVRGADGKERSISYLPQGKQVDVPRYLVDAARFERAPDECLAWFARK